MRTMHVDFEKARRTMVESQVRTNDVTDLRLLDAIGSVPRERFLPTALRPLAYVERELEYAPGRALLTPRDFAKLVSAAAPRAGEVVLDVACGTGYSTAVLAQLCEMVVGLEADEGLTAAAQANLTAVGATNAAVIAGDPATGAPGQGPFDLIFLGGAVEFDPQTLLGQLKEGGRLATLLKSGSVTRGVIYRSSGGTASARAVFDAASRTVAPGFSAPRRFIF
jgi:protein-L-isoaspartate(D-aspartate) O-methyltransferase